MNLAAQNRERAKPIVIVGSVAFDNLELPSGRFDNVVGGAATYAAFAASFFAPTRMVGVVGEDFPESVLADLQQRGVDTAGILRQPGKTFRWTGRYSANLASRETLDTQLNVFEGFNPELPAHYRDSPLVLLGNIHPELQLRVLAQIRAPELVAADTMNLWIEQERTKLLEVLARIDLLIVNDEELRLLGQDHNLRRCAEAVLSFGPKRLVCKRGDAGAMLFQQGGVFFSPALPLHHEVDPTGAGDTFAGALLGHMAQRDSQHPAALKQAIQVGTVVASVCVEGVGSEALRALSLAGLETRLGDLRSMTNAD